MKTKLLFSALFLLIFFTTTAQQWEAVGPDDYNIVSYGRGDNPSMAFDNNKNTYVAFVDLGISYKASVRKFDGIKWTNIGERGFSPSSVSQTSIALDNFDKPYVLFKDGNLNGKASVMSFNGSNWEYVGTPGFSTGSSIDYTTIKISKNNTLYVSYHDPSEGGPVVKKFDGTSWVDIGIPGFYSGTAYRLDMSISSTETPYVVFQTAPQTSTARTMKFDGTSWVNMGNNPTNSSYEIRMNITENDTLYVAYADGNLGRKAVVKKFDGTGWTLVGTEGFSTNNATSISLTFDDSDTPLIAYNNTITPIIKKFNGADWDDFDSIDITPFSGNNISLGFNSDQKLFIQFKTQNNDQKIMVKEFDGTNWNDTGTPGFSVGSVSSASYAIAPDNTLYAIFGAYSSNNMASVKKFNGSGWELVGMEGFSDGTAYDTDIAVNSSDIPYVAYADGNSKRATVKRFDGSTWVNVGTPRFSGGIAEYITLTFDNNDVPYIAYRDWGDGFGATVQKFDGTNWVVVGKTNFSEGHSYFLNLTFDNSNIPHVVYSDGSNGGRATVRKFDGTDWVVVGPPGFSPSGTASNTTILFDSSNSPFVVYNINLGSSNTIEVRRFDGTSWSLFSGKPVDSNNQGFNYTSFALDAEDTPYVIYYNSKDYGKATVRRYNGNEWVSIGIPAFTSGIANYTELHFDSLGNLFSFYGSPDLFAKKVDAIDLTYNQIFGTVLFDLDRNGCDASDEVIPSVRVTIDNGIDVLSSFTNDKGEYFFLFPEEGIFNVKVHYDNELFVSAPVDYTLDFTGGKKTENANFCLEANGDQNDLSILFYRIGRRPVPGFEVEYEMLYLNNGNTTLDGYVDLQFNEELMEYLSSTEPPETETNNTLIYGFLNLKPFKRRKIRTKFKVPRPPAANPGDKAPISPNIYPIDNDRNPDDNKSPFDDRIYGSFDPNDITVVEGDEITMDETNNYLNYIIRFQNIGNIDATNVRVENILDPNLDWDSFQLLNTSHESYVEIRNGNDVKFYFDNIYLADSTSNEPESHGYIVYRIKPKPGIDIGDIMSNKADIFFDFNAPVATNTVNTEVANALSVKQNELTNFSVFPIPSSNLLSISSRTEINQIKIFNYFGQLVFTRQVKSGLKENTIDISSIKPGIYFVRIRDENNATGTKKIIKM